MCGDSRRRGAAGAAAAAGAMQRTHAAGCAAYRLRHWITDQVDSGKYPGLAWEDEARSTFRIPWKHASKKEYRHEEDAAVFKAWAIFKGKYRAGEERADASTWKTRLRCALNKSPDFQELSDRSQTASGEAFKVYRILPEESTTRCDCARDSDEIMPPEEPEENQEVSMAVMESAPWCYSPEMLLNFPGYYIIDVRFFYKGALVSEQWASRLCRVGHRAPAVHDPSVYGPSDAAQLLFPPPASALAAPGDARQRAHTETLLANVERGVLLSVTGEGLFAQRLCRAQVFWSGPCAETPPGAPNKMERGPPVQLFNTRQFMEEMNQYVTWHGPSPQFVTTICFGEEFPDMDGAKKYVTVQVEARFARLLYEKAKAEGACSLREFEISAPNKEDEILDIIKSLCDSIAISS
ncbi:interferon regulatory factor 8-like [Lampetra fluviatilis]